MVGVLLHPRVERMGEGRGEGTSGCGERGGGRGERVGGGDTRYPYTIDNQVER
jgi:hypothetical protein